MAERKDTKTRKTPAESMAAAKQRAAEAEQRLAAAAAKKPKRKPEPSPQLKLELWPDDVRGVPNAVLRGALFGVSRERQIHRRRTLIVTTDGYEIRFKGETFNQSDLDVFEGLLHIARPHPLGARVEFYVNAFLKMLDMVNSGKNQEDFKEAVARLGSGWVEITDTKAGVTFMGALVQNAYRHEESGRYVVVFNKKMLALFGAGYTRINWDERMMLGQSSLAKWLHDYYATHAAPYPHKVQTLRDLCGSQTAELYKFRQQLRKALAELVSIGAIVSWDINDDDLVTVQRKPSPSQRKHLMRKAAKVIPRNRG